ncbi:FEKKY domain-containing protein [Flammeovirga pacifica]|uniref:Uncharacterized protein n=1 Tax=Flammeovirga pacifica TaxID=915059 RepID=A0A1S1YV38_FLAPC|nr:hypothetical protein [Flammeovirga pacifica]OHX64887.1 hypothetical protein NH26_00275 [Flammeovirga pacifica]
MLYFKFLLFLLFIICNISPVEGQNKDTTQEFSNLEADNDSILSKLDLLEDKEVVWLLYYSKAQLDSTSFNKLISVTDSQIARKFAIDDISKGFPLLLLSNCRCTRSINSGKKYFEQKYDICYYEYGCEAPPIEIMIAYNQEIFSYLTKVYNKKWLLDINLDVIGLKETY